MKLLLLGKNGQLGWELHRCLQPLGNVVALDYPEINMAEAGSLRKTIQEHRPDTIINATAYTNVDKAESEPDLADAINGTGPGVLAVEARKLNAVLLHFSTDYVFDGAKGSPYMETDPTRPLNVYGESKLAGERAIQSIGGDYLILRTAWVYNMHHDSFVSKVLGWARRNETLRIVDDQISNPTWARMLAEITAQILARDVDHIREFTGLYHLAGRGSASRFEWAQAILAADPHREEQVCTRLEQARSADFPTPALRPLFSALDCGKFESAFPFKLPDWILSLNLAMARTIQGSG